MPGTSCGSWTRWAARLLRVPASVRSKPAAAGQRDAQGERALAGFRRGGGQGVVPAQPARAGEVYAQVQPVGVDVEELAVPGDTGDGAPGQRGVRRVVGLQDADRDGQDIRDLPPDQLVGQEVPQRLDFGQFRHTYQGAPAGRPQRAALAPRSSASSCPKQAASRSTSGTALPSATRPMWTRPSYVDRATARDWPRASGAIG